MKRSRTSVDVTIAEVQISQSDIVRDVDQHSVLDRCATGRRTSLRVGVAVARRHESAVGTESLHGATHRVSRGTPYVSASRQCKHGGEYAVYVLACVLYHAVSAAIQTSASARHACLRGMGLTEIVDRLGEKVELQKLVTEEVVSETPRTVVVVLWRDA